MTDDPQAAGERRAAARHLVTHPLTCQEHDPDMFRLIRRHESELDQWFTQRLGYRLLLSADTARLWKSGVVPEHRPQRTASGRPLHHLEYVLLALAIGSTVAGPAVVSLRDLVDLIRSAAAEADIPLAGDSTERRALVAVLRWMIDHGLARELHAHVEAYASDAAADAVLELRPDRIALLPLPAMAGLAAVAGDAGEELLARGERRELTRQWLRARLVEDPVVYRHDLMETEWIELRRRLGEEERYLDEMFGLVLEARAEGVAAVDPDGALSGRPFPSGGTVNHAALLLIGMLRREPTRWWTGAEIVDHTAGLAADHARNWAGDLVAAPERLAQRAVDLLVEFRLAERRSGTPPPDEGRRPGEVRLLPAAARFVAIPKQADGAGNDARQEAMW